MHSNVQGNVQTSTHTLQISKTLAASPARVYEAWTNPELLRQWFAPDNDFTTIVHMADVRVGGEYRIEMVDPSGAPHTAVGRYTEVVPGVRLAFTWKWAEQATMQDTMVTLDFAPQGEGTELMLTHSLFLTTDDRDHHGKGWDGCLGRLVETLQPS